MLRVGQSAHEGACSWLLEKHNFMMINVYMHFEALCTSMLVSYDIFFGILFYSRLEMIMMCCSTLSHCLPFWCAIKLPNLMPVYSEWRRATRTRILHPLGFWTLVIPHPLNPVCAKTRLRCARHCPSSYCVATLFFFTI